MLKHLSACLFSVTILLATVHGAAADKRVALVIGNSAYQHTAPLRNPSNDASDMAAKLRALGFDVIEGTDLTKSEMESRIRTFSDKLTGSDVGLFFYAGHGLAVDGKNFLAPVDASLKSDADVDFETVELNLVLKQMERNSRLSLVFLDACRNNPLATSLASGSRSLAVSRGLARVEKAVGMMIAFATRPEDVALDGEGRNSPFTGALLRHIDQEGASVNDLMIEVRNDVLKATDGKQVPWENSSLTGQFYFKPTATQVADNPGETAKEIAALKQEINRLQADQGARLQSQQDQLEVLQQKLELASKAQQSGPQVDAAASPTATPPATNRVITVEPANTPASAAPTPAAAPAPSASAEPAPADAKVAAAESADAASKEPESAPAAPPPLPEGVTREQLAIDIVTALKDLDCYRGKVTGQWGDRSQDALGRFNDLAKLDLPVDEPAPPTLEAIKGWKGAHCAIEHVVAPRLKHAPAPKEVIVPAKPGTKNYRAKAYPRPPYRPREAESPPPPHHGGGDEINELQRLFPETYRPSH
jgi:uncharacterized caspase-like protein